jgi:hypothetical protein
MPLILGQSAYFLSVSRFRKDPACGRLHCCSSFVRGCVVMQVDHCACCKRVGQCAAARQLAKKRLYVFVVLCT